MGSASFRLISVLLLKGRTAHQKAGNCRSFGAQARRLRLDAAHRWVSLRCRAQEVAATTYAVAAKRASTTPTRKGSAGTDEAVEERSRAT